MSVKLKVGLIIFVVLLIDQVLKVFIKLNFTIGEYVEVFSWFRILFIENPGMAFGLQLGGDFGKFLLTFFRIILVGGLIYYIHLLIKKQVRTGFILTVALLIAGATGNIIDSVFYGVLFSESTFHQVAVFLPEGGGYARLFHGNVVDMFYFPIISNADGRTMFFPWIFNIADSAVTIAVFLILIFFRKEFNDSLESKKTETTPNP
jgi:signal peptidase II